MRTTIQVDKNTSEMLSELELTTSEGIPLKTQNDKIIFLVNFFKNNQKNK